jgi:hypothetical protein
LASALSYKTVENFGVSVDVHMTGPDAALVTAPSGAGPLAHGETLHARQRFEVADGGAAGAVH